MYIHILVFVRSVYTIPVVKSSESVCKRRWSWSWSWSCIGFGFGLECLHVRRYHFDVWIALRDERRVLRYSPAFIYTQAHLLGTYNHVSTFCIAPKHASRHSSCIEKNKKKKKEEEEEEVEKSVNVHRVCIMNNCVWSSFAYYIYTVIFFDYYYYWEFIFSLYRARV